MHFDVVLDIGRMEWTIDGERREGGRGVVGRATISEIVGALRAVA